MFGLLLFFHGEFLKIGETSCGKTELWRLLYPLSQGVLIIRVENVSHPINSPS
jgi:hypothetical protein